jgi:acetylornithine/N-succinyldiaminopimelate aminotransferase
MKQVLSPLIGYPGHELLLPEIVRAENGRVHDSAGRSYVDLESGVWCTSIGHGHPRLLRVIAEQSQKIAHAGYCYSSPVVEEAAREILDVLGFENGRCVFLASGSEAVEYSVRIARVISDRPLLLTMTDSYFGAYGSASLKRRDEWFCYDWLGCAGCPTPDEAGRSCEHWAAIPFDRIGGFLFEPGSSSGLVRFPPVALIRRIVNAIRQANGLVLVNEVTTGIGRTGTWFGYQHYGIAPDIVALGKGLGNGYPVSVTAISPATADRLGSRSIKYAQSHQNDPLGAAVAREVCRVVREENLIERGREIAQFLGAGLEGIASRTGRIAQVRRRGLMIALDLADDPDGSFAARTHRELLQRGFIVAQRPGLNVLRIDPPLTIERGDIEAFLEALEDILRNPS